jgi:flagellar hook protein FlgE
LTIGEDGSLNVTDSAGNRVIIGYLSMATFANPSGLMRAGDSLFQASSNSGTPTYQVAGTNGSGTLMSGTLEGSNVDLTQEFANMIVAQNGFAANSHMIGTDNTVLQDIVNLKNS